MPLTWMRRKRTWLGVCVASCAAVLIAQLPLSAWISTANTWLAGQGIWTIPLFTATYITAAIFGIPNIILILAAGTLFGLKEGVINASVADTLSIAVCFGIGQSVGRRWITGLIGESSRFHKLDRAFAQKGWKIVLLTRLSPVLPSNILNYGFSITRINFWEYLFFSWLGMLPVIFTYVYVGKAGATLLTLDQQPENLMFQAVGLLATLGVMMYATKLATSALQHGETT
ncbi:MAG: TVP38/TMEM64 family protein [Cyanobacteria bacterium J06576_12]